jgi:signal transduction histidine kinase
LEGGVRMEFGPVSLVDALRHCREVHQWHADGRSIEFQVEFPEDLPAVRGDERWLRQVLDNLVSNAIKFTPQGGQVRIAAKDKGDAVQISVADTGVGISPEDQVHIFEKFYRARNRAAINAPGTGLGLAIAKAVVEKHEGKIWFESEPGRGSKFHLLLPAYTRVGEPTGLVAPQAEKSLAE